MAILRLGGTLYVTPDNLIYPEIMAFLKKWAQKKDHEKYIALAFCEYKVSDVYPPTHIPPDDLPPNFIVVCIRYIKSNMYQPIGTLFLHNSEFNGYGPSERELGDCLRLYIIALSKLAYKVVATVSPPTFTFKKALSDLTGIPDMSSYKGPLVYSVAESRDIVHIFDPPSLLKAFRNLFLLLDIEYKMNNKTFCARWTDIITLYNRGQLPFLSEEHVSLDQNVFQNKFAVELFNSQISSIITDGIKSGLLLADAMGTSILMKMFKDVFDTFNQVADRNSINSHMNLWEKAVKFLDSIRFLERADDTEMKCQGMSKAAAGYYSFEDNDNDNWSLLQEFGRLDKSLNSQISMMQKIQHESAQGRLRVIPDEFLYKSPLDSERKMSNKYSYSDTTSNAINEELENDVKEVDGTIEIPLLKCTTDVRLASGQSKMNNFRTMTALNFDRMKKQVQEKRTIEGQNIPHQQPIVNTEPYNILGIPLTVDEDFHASEINRKIRNSEKITGGSRDYDYIDLHQFIAKSANSDVKDCYGFIEESTVGKDDNTSVRNKSEQTPLLHSERNKSNYKSTETCNIKDKQNQSVLENELENIKEKTLQEAKNCDEYNPYKNSSNNIDSSIPEEDKVLLQNSDESHKSSSLKSPLNNTIDTSKSSNDPVKNLNVYTENDTNLEKNEPNILQAGKTHAKNVNVKNDFKDKEQKEKKVEDSDPSSLADKIVNLNIDERNEKNIEDICASSVIENNAHSTLDEKSSTQPKNDQSVGLNHANQTPEIIRTKKEIVLDTDTVVKIENDESNMSDSNMSETNDILEVEAMRKDASGSQSSSPSDTNASIQSVTNENLDKGTQELTEMPGFESDSETDMPSIPISDILEKLEAPDRKPDVLEKPLASSYIPPTQSSNLQTMKRSHEIINNWMSTVDGIHMIVKILEGRGFGKINTKAFSTGCLDEFISDARKSNELKIPHKVSPDSQFKMLDEGNGISAMERGSVQLMKR